MWWFVLTCIMQAVESHLITLLLLTWQTGWNRADSHWLSGGSLAAPPSQWWCRLQWKPKLFCRGKGSLWKVRALELPGSVVKGTRLNRILHTSFVAWSSLIVQIRLPLGVSLRYSDRNLLCMELHHPAHECICVNLTVNIQLKLLSQKFAATNLFHQPSLLH